MRKLHEKHISAKISKVVFMLICLSAITLAVSACGGSTAPAPEPEVEEVQKIEEESIEELEELPVYFKE